MQLSEAILKYYTMKFVLLPNSAPSVAKKVKEEMKEVRENVWISLAEIKEGQIVKFDNPMELAGTLDLLHDTGRFFGVDWKRRTTSKNDPTKQAGDIGTMAVKKVNGMVKGTTGGAKAFQDLMAGRVTLWACKGKLYQDGFGNWRSIYASDVVGLRLKGKVIEVKVG